MTRYEIKAARKALGLSQNGMARLLHVSDGRTVRRWEAGERDIPGPAVVLVSMLMKSKAARDFLNVSMREE